MDLGDKRRDERATKMMRDFAAMRTGSIPQACGDWADTIGAYRFFDNDAVALMSESDGWKAAYILNAVLRLVARLGGFLARKGDGGPGVKTIWLGMQRIIDFAAGIQFSRELLAQGTCA